MSYPTSRIFFETALIAASGLFFILISLINPLRLHRVPQVRLLHFYIGEQGARLFLAFTGLAMIAFAAGVRLAKS